MQDPLGELHQLRQLVQQERAAELDAFRRLLERLPLEERVSEGFSWYPVEVVKQGYTLGARAFVIVQRHSADQPHQMRAGKTVRLFTRQAGVKHPDYQGVIQYVNRSRMKIVLNQQDMPPWLALGLIGVDLLFDDRPYLEMDKALQRVINGKGDRIAELRDILLGHLPSRLDPESPTALPALPYLNDTQRAAVVDIVSTPDVAVVHGPPGTGKTTTIVAAVQQLVTTESTVLLTAPSNTAVDLLTEQVAAAGLRVVRIGNLSRIDDSILVHTLEMQLAQHPDSKTIKKVRIQAAEVRRQAQRYRRTFGADERTERRELYREAGELNAWAQQLEDRLLDQILSGAQVVTATLVGSAHSVLEQRKFRTVIIDEAAQALEPACWIPILRASRVVLVGDPYQLPPTVKSAEAQRGGLAVTLIEKALLRLAHTRLLAVQYRMNEVIMGFSNQQFYAGQLRAAPAVAQQRLSDGESPLVYIDTAGCGFEEQVQPAYQSRYNPEEFLILREHLYQLVGLLAPGETWPTVAIISPYREQVEYMQQALADDAMLADLAVSIDTIDGFQGQERDVVYISLVRSNERQEIGFLRDYRRMNVALTRARYKLVVVGNSATIGGDDFYAQFIAYAEQHGTYQTAWEYLQ